MSAKIIMGFFPEIPEFQSTYVRSGPIAAVGSAAVSLHLNVQQISYTPSVSNSYCCCIPGATLCHSPRLIWYGTTIFEKQSNIVCTFTRHMYSKKQHLQS